MILPKAPESPQPCSILAYGRALQKLYPPPATFRQVPAPDARPYSPVPDQVQAPQNPNATAAPQYPPYHFLGFHPQSPAQPQQEEETPAHSSDKRESTLVYLDWPILSQPPLYLPFQIYDTVQNGFCLFPTASHLPPVQESPSLPAPSPPPPAPAARPQNHGYPAQLHLFQGTAPLWGIYALLPPPLPACCSGTPLHLPADCHHNPKGGCCRDEGQTSSPSDKHWHLLGMHIFPRSNVGY